MNDYRHILVTGGNGRLGRALGAQGCLTLNRSECDITKSEYIRQALEAYKPRLVINCAAYTQVDAAEDNQDAAYAANHIGAKYLAEACAKSETPLIHISTDCVFGDSTPSLFMTEDDACVPLSVYGKSKWLGEEAVRKSGERAIVVRVSWLFDDGQDTFIDKILNQSLAHQSLRVVQDAYGRPTSTRDLAHILIKLSERMIDGMPVPAILHIGPQDPVSRYDWAKVIFEHSGKLGHLSPELVPCPAGDFPEIARRPRGLILDIASGNALLGLMPDWRTATAEAVAARLAANT